MFKLRYILCVFFFANFISLKAADNRAGEITYKWLNGYTYQIKITTYTKIGSSGLGDRCEVTLNFGDGLSAVILRSNGPVGSCAPAHEGVAISPFIKLNEYITTYTFPGSGNYKMSMEDPNRNAGVINIPNSVNQPFYIESYLVIPTFSSGKNDSPVLSIPPFDKGRVGNCFLYNPGANDVDGDSLSYELTLGRGQSGAPCSGYSYPSAGAGGTYSVNNLSGTLTWCSPQQTGEYNLAMIIKEWRKKDDGSYFLIGYILRDLQIDVEIPLGLIQETKQETPVLIFPNPAQDLFSLDLSLAQIEYVSFELYDNNGRLIEVLLRDWVKVKQNTFQFSLRDVSSGIYYLKVNGNKGTNITKKIIKE